MDAEIEQDAPEDNVLNNEHEVEKKFEQIVEESEVETDESFDETIDESEEAEN